MPECARPLMFVLAATLMAAVPGPGLAAPSSAEMPELAGAGPHAVGTAMQQLAVGERSIGVRLWFPAEPGASGDRAIYRHRRALPGQQALEVAETGMAFAQASPLAGKRFPLIVISHGYGGWSEHMSQLGEVLSSRGYVVASVDHRDRPFSDAASFAMSFGAVLLHRASDQQAVLRALLGNRLAPPGVAAQIDSAAIGLLGFSMGGHGALVTAGAAPDPGAPAYALFPAAMRALLPRPDAAQARQIKAVVAMAPWGAQPGAMVWRDTDLAALRAPLLLIAGDQDDVVDFERGVKRVFAAARGSDRYLLVYREAAHNVAGNPMALPADADFQTIEFLTDPVWRKERIEAINQHFIGAFFDLHLKGETARRKFLDVPTPIASAGQWPSAFGQQWGATKAGDQQPGYWRGFQRRWARGLELHHKAAGE